MSEARGILHTVDVTTPSRSYQVLVGNGILDALGERVRDAAGGDAAFVVSDTNVAPLYLSRAVCSLERAGFRTASCVIPAGEQHKRLATFGTIVEAMADARLTRSSVVVALGGGVVGDMAGFAAASYMRGIRVVQVPTTLLAMVDSSVGGKTAIDLAAGKNLVGAFLQPSLVLADVSTLSTLSHTVFADGMGEVVKHAVLADKSLFDTLLTNPLSQASTSAYLAEVVARNVCIKRDVVQADEREQGLRQTLNLGHTIGHAVEAASDFSLGHGHCVAIGLCAMARAAESLGWAHRGLAARIQACVRAQGLPTDTRLSHDALFEFATHDKKGHANTTNVVVARDLGDVGIMTVTHEDLRRIIDLGCGTEA